jgi:hypothetical protein
MLFCSVFMVKAKGGRLFTDEIINKLYFYATTTAEMEGTENEEAFIKCVKLFGSFPNQRPIEELNTLVMWILQDMDTNLKSQCVKIFEGFKDHVEHIKTLFEQFAVKSTERHSAERKDDATRKNILELQHWFDEKPLSVPPKVEPLREVKVKVKSLDPKPMARSSSVSSVSSNRGMGSRGSNASLRSLRSGQGSTASLNGMNRSDSNGLDMYRLTQAILSDGLHPARRIVRVSRPIPGSNGFPQQTQMQAMQRSPSKDMGLKTAVNSLLTRRRRSTGVPQTFIDEKLLTTVYIHTGMLLFLDKMGWRREEDMHRVVGITAISDYITEKVTAESKKVQFTFFVSTEKLDEMKKAPPDPIASHCTLKVRRKASDNISVLAPPKVNSKQKSMIFMSLLSDMACTILLKLSALIRMGWAGEEISMESMKAVFGTSYSSIDEKYFVVLCKWLHINRSSSAGFELLNRSNIETGIHYYFYSICIHH